MMYKPNSKWRNSPEELDELFSGRRQYRKNANGND